MKCVVKGTLELRRIHISSQEGVAQNVKSAIDKPFEVPIPNVAVF
jgi:hypothetical protein